MIKTTQIFVNIAVYEYFFYKVRENLSFGPELSPFYYLFTFIVQKIDRIFVSITSYCQIILKSIHPNAKRAKYFCFIAYLALAVIILGHIIYI